jgi:transcriptional regulator with XRE-family HTH domain
LKCTVKTMALEGTSMSRNSKPTIGGAECRAARALLGWTRIKLEEASGAPDAQVSARTIANFEAGTHATSARTIRDLQRALEFAGVQFRTTQKGIKLGLEAPHEDA